MQVEIFTGCISFSFERFKNITSAEIAFVLFGKISYASPSETGVLKILIDITRMKLCAINIVCIRFVSTYTKNMYKP